MTINKNLAQEQKRRSKNAGAKTQEQKRRSKNVIKNQPKIRNAFFFCKIHATKSKYTVKKKKLNKITKLRKLVTTW